MKKMKTGSFVFLSLVLSAVNVFCFCSESVNAAGFGNPIKKLLNGNNDVEADPNKVYSLTEKNGPWLILLCSFNDNPVGKVGEVSKTGEAMKAEQKANILVYELRKKFKLKAYVFAGEFSRNLKNDFKSDGNWQVSAKSRAMNNNYLKKGSFIEYAVLVGDYQSPEELQNDREKMRNISPDCMFQMFSKSAGKPFPMPFAVPNPILPVGYFAQSDNNLKFIEKLNEKRDFSLLSCPRKYTVQVATFSGQVTFRGDANINSRLNSALDNGKRSQLELAELSADKLCKALRKNGFEAYQYHDQFSSIVTVGGFDYYYLPDGTTLRPEIVQIMNYFRGNPIRTGNRAMPYSYTPVKFDGIECDMSPKVIEIPKGTKIVEAERHNYTATGTVR
jgi:hypothetical protein